MMSPETKRLIAAFANRFCPIEERAEFEGQLKALIQCCVQDFARLDSDELESRIAEKRAYYRNYYGGTGPSTAHLIVRGWPDLS